jgi:hypothetical protein
MTHINPINTFSNSQFISDEQKKIVLDNARIKLVNGVAGGHKCLGKNTPILMFDGSIKLVQDIVVGDILMGDDSAPRNVLDICSGVDELYEINNQKQESYVVNSQHILSLKYSRSKKLIHRPERHSYQVIWFDKGRLSKSFHYKKNDAKDQLYVLTEAKTFFKNVTHNLIWDINLQDYLSLSRSYKKDLKGYKVKVEFQETPLPMDPYILGIWLGDGSKSEPRITNQDATILKYLSNNLPKINCYMTYTSNYSYYINSTQKNYNYFTSTLRQLSLINDKHIPDIYKINSTENRLKLLAGIIDSDGYAKKNGIFSITQKSEKLFDDIVFLCQSLGLACHKKKHLKHCYYKGIKRENYYYTAVISGEGLEKIPTLCKRKMVPERKQIKDVLVSGIQVKPLGSGEYYGFEIDGNRRFLLGNFTVTHNTSTLIKCGIRHLEEGLNVIFLTKISSVTDEITKRLTRNFGINFTKSASHFIGQHNGNWCCVANFDSFIDKQLRKSNLPFEGEAFNQKVKQLNNNMDKLNDGLYMKNEQKIDVVLIDEVQDFDKIRIEFTQKIFTKFTDLRGVFVGDTLQTVFIQSIMGDSFSMNYLKSNLDCKYFQLSTCYRCPKGQIDFVNKVMGPYQQQYGIVPIISNNNNMIDKPVLFQHHSVHKEYERADLCKRVIYIIDYVLNIDTTVNPDDIVVVMNKTNSNAVFEKLLVELNNYYRKRYNNENYKNVIHYKTKNQEGRKTIDWSIGEEKTKFISVHGIKGKGQKVVILLGMSEKSIPMVEWLFKTEELISQSVMNVALTRSERYLFVGVNSIPSRYINNQFDEIYANDLAYCSWNEKTYRNIDPFYKNLLVGFEQFEKFNFVTDKYTKNVIYTPSKSILAIKEDIVQEYHISDCISNAFGLMSDEVMTKTKIGKRFYIKNSFNIVERGILGILCELLVQRYMRVYTKNLYYDNAFLLMYHNKDTENYLFTNNQSLLNIVFDTKLNGLVKKSEKDWRKQFEIVKSKCKHIKSLREFLGSIKTPTYILDNTFQRMNIKSMLDIYFSSIANDKVNTKIFWNLALFYSALSGHYKMTSVMMYIDSFNANITNLHVNTKEYCHKYLIAKMAEYNISFQKEINVIRRISDPEILSVINPEILEKEDGQRFYKYGIMGISDVILNNKSCDESVLHEIKCISSSDSGKVKTWIFQSVLYSYLLKKLSTKNQNNVKKIVIANLLSGTIWEFDMTKIAIKYKDMISYIMKEKHFPEQLIEMYLQNEKK